ncbi:MAG: FAD-dependent oxidoreductase, partial [Myxococcota bacterium]
MKSFEVIVIGAGPGGYVAAIRAAQLGYSTAIVEKESALGGTCLRVGCIPSKALLESSELYAQTAHHLTQHGIEVNTPKLRLDTMLGRKQKIVEELTLGVKLLMQKNKIQVLEGHGSFVEPGVLVVVQTDGTRTSYGYTSAIVATGSAPVEIPSFPFDHKLILDSTDALALSNVPQKMLVVGAGAIGLEMGCVWQRLGCEVTVVEMFDRIAPFADKQISKAYQRTLERQGLTFLLGHQVKRVQTKKKSVLVDVEDR